MGVNIADLCAEHSQVFASKGELRRLVQGGGLSINKVKIDNADLIIGTDSLLNNKYLLVQKGKKELLPDEGNLRSTLIRSAAIIETSSKRSGLLSGIPSSLIISLIFFSTGFLFEI